MLELEDIYKVYGKGENAFQALKGVNLKIDKGEFVSIMGPSGSGKSTLMNILGALDKPTQGKYILNGKDISQYKEKELAKFRNKEVGFIFQRFNLMARTNVFDNVALPGRYGNLQNLHDEVLKALKAVGLQDKIKNDSNSLSGGQIQRVAIARALVMSPSIIMADEPTGNLDTKTGDKIMKLLQKLNAKGHTIILVTHSEEISKYSKRIIKIRDGEVEDDYMLFKH